MMDPRKRLIWEHIARRSWSQSVMETPDWLHHSAGAPHSLVINPAEKEFVDLLRIFGELTKSEMESITEYSRTKITACVDSLLHKQYIVENGATGYTGGRRARTYSINSGLGLVAGVDIGATSIDLAVADLSRRILIRYCEPAQVRDGPLMILGRVSTLLESLLTEKHFPMESVVGVGIGIPGPVDFSLGTVVSPPIMPGWDRYPIIATMQQWFPSANVVVDNDVNVMALGELQAGTGKGAQNLIFVKIGTGIGSGIICEGQIYRGASGCAGDIGHISVKKDGPLCHCGNRGCLEAMTGGPAIAERAMAAALNSESPILKKRKDANGGTLTTEDVGAAAREGDPLSIEIIRESGQMVGGVLASLVNFFNPERIVIGGGVSNLGDLLLSSIRQAVLNRSTPLATRNLQVGFSPINPDAGVIGAISLAMEYLFTVEASGANGSGQDKKDK